MRVTRVFKSSIGQKIMEQFDENSVLKHSQHFFSSLTLENFHNLFKLNAHHVTFMLNNSGQQGSHRNQVRNILIFLFQLKHYLPVRAACILFFIEKTQFNQIFHEQIDLYFEKFKHFIDIENRKHGNDKCALDFPDTFIVVDSTEVVIASQEKKKFSGKKKHFTLKYQTIVGAVTGEILGVHGPEDGPVGDAKIYVKSGLKDFLIEEDEHCLADKGYVGCERAIHPIRKKKSAFLNEKIPFSTQQIQFNKKVSHHRIKIGRAHV